MEASSNPPGHLNSSEGAIAPSQSSLEDAGDPVVEKPDSRKAADGHKTDASDQRFQYYRHGLRAWGVSLLITCLTTWKRWKLEQRYEAKKVAVFRNVWLFAADSAFHLIPIGVGIGLVWLNLRGYYVGSTYAGALESNSIKLVGFQVAAKLVELVAVASMASFILALVRHELTSVRGVPFAALSASLNFSSLPYLWSSEHWALLFSSSMSRYRRILFFVALTVGTLLGTLIGPTVAVLIQSRLNWWSAGGTDVWIDASLEALFPPILNDTAIIDGFDCIESDNENCPSSGWPTITSWLQSLKFNDHRITSPGLGAGIPDSGLMFTIQDAMVYPMFGLRPHFPSWISNSTWMTVPQVTLSRAFTGAVDLWWVAARESFAHDETRFSDYQDARFAMVALGPTISTRCNATVYLPQENSHCIIFPLMKPASPEDVVQICGNQQLEQWAQEDLRGGSESKPRLHWIEGNLAAPNTIGIEIPNGFSGGALMTFPGESNGHDYLVGCTVKASYEAVTYHKDRFIGAPTQVSFGYDTWKNVNPEVPVGWMATLQTTWLDSLNPHLAHTNSTVFDQMVSATGVWQDEGIRRPLTNRLEAIILFMIGNGLARTTPTTYPVAEVSHWNDKIATGPWWRQLMPQHGTFSRGGDAYNLTDADRARFYKNTVYAATYGFAYAYFDSSGSLWSAVTVIAYVVFALVLFCVLLRRGFYTSTSWASISELNALALESDPFSHEFHNTTAGIDTMGPLMQSVRLLPKDGKLQMVATDGDQDDHSVVMANTKY